MPLEQPLVFYVRMLWEWLVKHGRLLALILTYLRAMVRAKRNGPATQTEDLAMLPAGQEEVAVPVPAVADLAIGLPMTGGQKPTPVLP